MALSKIQAESMNLADTYAFSGTVSGLPSGSSAFMARISVASAWVSINQDQLIPFNNDSTGDSFDTDGVFNTTTYKFTAPATGVYIFWYAIYTADNGQTNSFGFLKNTARLQVNDSSDSFSYLTNSSNDHMQTATVILPLTSGNTIGVVPTQTSEYYTTLCQWGGCRLA